MLNEIGRGMRGRFLGAGEGSGGPVDPSLRAVVASTVFDLDATQADCYAGTGTTWANLVAAPADGAARAAYDFYTADGATAAAYPAFTGAAGSAAAYWAFDGGDYFRLKSGVHTPFLANLHKTTGGQDFWLAVAWRTPPADTGFDFLFTTQTDTSQPGIVIYQDGNERLVSGQRGDAASSTVTRSAALSENTDYLVILSHSHAANQTRMWVNSPVCSQHVQTYAATTTTAAGPARISGRDGSNLLAAGTRLYGVAMGNAYLDDAGAAAIYAALESRHGRDYTP